MSQNDRAYSEKRDFIRMRLDAPAILEYAGKEIPARCLDLSSTGMQIEADCQIAEGDQVTVRIPSEHDELKGLEARAEVVRVTALDNQHHSIGLTILSMS